MAIEDKEGHPLNGGGTYQLLERSILLVPVS
jgi:hypothetical protein